MLSNMVTTSLYVVADHLKSGQSQLRWTVIQNTYQISKIFLKIENTSLSIFMFMKL